ncbi:hypothetical protein Ahy_B03g067788 [Arachis hypogaea]|uniref:Replication factor A C-terminal domain-containing protein n=1 Tax=Arachis hypogaea TaxID=3818 RepID=A0A445A7R1_ARAHY|nr:hypothetical protein Ahy_B03g067788 [Arachis hypogaea]
MKIELDDLSEKLSCTLWENYASELVTRLVANKATEFIIVLQFAKMKFYNGVMTITNTNYTTRLMVNADLEVVKKFRQKSGSLTKALVFVHQSLTSNLTHSYIGCDMVILLIGLGTKHKPSVDVIGRVVRHFPFEDFLSLTPYAPIHQIKQTVEKSTYVTCGMVIDIDRDHAWWYKACRQCTQGLEALTDQFYYAKCDVYSTIFVARFSIQVRVVDDSDIATFVLFENSASKFLGLTATDIRTSMLAKGYRRDHFPEELNALAFMITISRICSNPEIIASLALEKNIKLVRVFDYSTKASQLALCIQLLLLFVFLNTLQSHRYMFQDALQKLTTAKGVHSGELIRNGSIVGVAGSTTPLSTKATSVSEHGADHVVTQTPVKRLCIRSDDDLSSRASLSASKSLLPAFEKCIPGNATDPVAEDM